MARASTKSNTAGLTLSTREYRSSMKQLILTYSIVSINVFRVLKLIKVSFDDKIHNMI